MDDELQVNRIVICSNNGKYRFLISVNDQGELIANPLLAADPEKPNLWVPGRTGRCLCPRDDSPPR
jgi:hypothetical protein